MLNQFNNLPPGPYLAPPATYGKTLEALATVSPTFASLNKQLSPSPGMLSPPNIPNGVCYCLRSNPNFFLKKKKKIYIFLNKGLNHQPNSHLSFFFFDTKKKQNHRTTFASNVLLQLPGLTQLTNISTNNNNNFLSTNMNVSTNGLTQPGSQLTNFGNLIALTAATGLQGLHQSLSPNWSATMQGLNSVQSLPSVTNAFTGSPIMTVNKTTNPQQLSNPYANFSLNVAMNGLSLSPPNLPVKDQKKKFVVEMSSDQMIDTNS
ncbi:hypothetical protein RFI_27943 [Reticulomyxa filosa]|uniref:Uncharacterized protein n=1 Tax=Reticulomyxa filosa TaxID=46433 RepID=X6M8T6_RETFI|nr:hypothetical protein RFI_27943 [Reticulomyxa filosa]|eukprot:ETO09430.1 hypothetical protein RFI_27943 [Reticulomyxa filosa]